MPATPRNIRARKAVRVDHLKAFGLLIYEWASFEFFLAETLSWLISGSAARDKTANDAAFAAVIGMDAKVKIGLFKSIALLRLPDQRDQIDKWADNVLSVKKVRDTIAHSPWEKASRPGYIKQIGMTAVGQIKFLRSEYNATDITNRAKDLDNLKHEMFGFLFHGAGVVALPLSLLKGTDPERAPLRRILRKEIRAARNAPPKSGKRARPRKRSPR